ncbi:hypothetical protein GCM10025779_18020 [Arthrobacter cryoconiti]
MGSGVHADAIIDRIIHDTIWIETGSYSMSEKIGPIQAELEPLAPVAPTPARAVPQRR